MQACRLIGKKGLLTAIRALADVVKGHPELHYVIAGEGPLKEKLKAAIDEHGLQSNVTLAGWLSQEQLLEEYRRAHVFLHPSEMTKESDQEGIPNSMLEAMATGLPVVATHHGGIPEAVASGHDGLLVPEKDPRALASALLKILGDPALLSSLSRNAATSVREHFGAATQIERLEDCYLEAISMRQREAAAKKERT